MLLLLRFSIFVCAILVLGRVEASDNDWRLSAGLIYADSSASGTVFGIPGSDGDLSDESTVFGSVLYQPGTHWGVELFLAPPFQHSVDAQGSIEESGKLASVKSIAPTMLVRYQFRVQQKAFRPYLALGLTYAIYFDEEPTQAFFDLAGAEFELDYENSLVPVFVAGFDYQLSEKWSVGALVGYLEPDPDISVTIQGQKTTVPSKLETTAYAMTIGYRF